MEVQINQIIGLNKLQYINMVDAQFNVWCEALSFTMYVPMRELQTDVKLHNWFVKKWESRIVKPFLQENNGQILDGIKAPALFNELFFDIVLSKNGMQGIYPGPIVKEIKVNHYKTIKSK